MGMRVCVVHGPVPADRLRIIAGQTVTKASDWEAVTGEASTFFYLNDGLKSPMTWDTGS